MNDICKRVGVQCTFLGQEVTIEGSWDLVQQVRQNIHTKIIEAGQNQARKFNQPDVSSQYCSSTYSQHEGSKSPPYGKSMHSYGSSSSVQGPIAESAYQYGQQKSHVTSHSSYEKGHTSGKYINKP